ncbi:SAV_2336 N-terminal domain-related protein [Nostoc sp. LPT]|uniref:SAV_2336 N-terminal domain-related protein n=1 Tax=Nostoc sp. LPT TaxID=2815387 RepID=UPI001D645A22|nr:SAV_2336 N-terminal domain-related protein [Nostoc sp. LPT]MBN4005426.1 GUN4 domain-containing protein [Nostoc sp. LPT]
MTPSESQSVPNSIERLIAELGEKLDLTGEQIADVLWLTLELQKFEPNPSIEKPESHELDKDTSPEKLNQPQANEQTKPTVPSRKQETNTKPSTEKKGSVYSTSGSGESQGLTIGVPDAPSLREPLTLANAFRPLMRRVATGRKLILDEAATVQRIAEEHIFIPILKAEPEPWLDLALVIDESHSMLIWGHTIGELKELFKKYGIFRDIRIWGLQPDEAGNNLQLFSRMGSNKRLTEPKEIIDPTGRRLILIVSDCVSNIWRKGMMFPVLKDWTQKQPLVILQMLPEWMWRRTALDLGTPVAFKSSIMGVANQELSLHKPLRRSRSIGFKVEERSKIPVITLDKEHAAQWSQMLVGKADALVSGYLLPPKLEIEDPSLQRQQNTSDAAERVQNFRMTTSPLGRELAGLLAASPVINLPVVRLIQESLLPKSNQVQVAEVFLGGLLRPKSASLKKLENEELDNRVNVNLDLVEYEFIKPEIRDIFLDDAAVSDSIDVVNAVSRYVAEQLGVSLKEFIAILKAPQKRDEQERKDTIQPFAEITARVLRKLGGEYVKFAEELEQASNKISSKMSDEEPVKDDDSSLREATSWTLQQSINHHQDQINCVVFSPDGQLIASASQDSKICLWNLSGDLIATLEGNQDKIWSIAFSIDSQFLVSGGNDGLVNLWSVSDSTHLYTWANHESIYTVSFRPYRGEITSLDNQFALIASAGKSSRIYLHNIKLNELDTLTSHIDIINCITFSPDGKLLASCSDDRTIKIWNLQQRALTITLQSHTDWVNAIAFNPKGDLIVSASSDNTVRLWSVNQGTLVKIFKGHTDQVSSVAFHPSGEIIASGSRDGTIRLWTLEGDLLGEPLQAHQPHVKKVAFSPNGKLLVSGGSDNTIKIWYDSLSQDNGDNYTQLKKLLEQRKWQEADQETARLMLQVVGREEEGWLSLENLNTFPCDALQMIDQCWLEFSQGHFGFSVQKDIWEKVGQNYDRFGVELGWKVEDRWLPYDDLRFDLTAPLGHLPCLSWVSQLKQAGFSSKSQRWSRLIKMRQAFFNRVQACDLPNLFPLTFRLTKKLFFAYNNGNATNLQTIENIINDNSWIEVTNEKSDADYIVAIDENEEYVICDRTETPYPNLEPPLSINSTDAAERLVKRLVHLAKYHAALSIEGQNYELNKAIEYELLDEERQPFPDANNISLKSGDLLYVRLKNVSSQPLNIALLDFEPTWEVSQIPIPGDRGAFYSLQEDEEILTRLRLEVPDGEYDRQVKETLKLFFTRGIANFQWLILPPLDRESQSRANLDKELRDVLAEYFDKDKDWSSKSINLTVIQPEASLNQQPQQEDKPTNRKKILLLASNAQGSLVIDLDREIRVIREGLRRSPNRNQFVIETRRAVRPIDLRRAMLEVNPQIVHFYGHGTGSQGLVLQDDDGNEHLVYTEALSALFQIFSNQVECVLLSGCYSEVQAQGIVEHINYVIGMNREVTDDATIAFTVGFYDALGAGESIERAFEIGRNAVVFEVSGHESQSRKLLPVDDDDIDVNINDPKNQDYLFPVLVKKV